MNPFDRIQSQIVKASCRAVELVAVSKRQPIESIRKLYDQGQSQFGENYVQEALTKMSALQNLNLKWHFIGHIQKNKIKHIVGRFALIQSVDSLEIALAMDHTAKNIGVVQDILVQINIAAEVTKSGISREHALNLASQIADLPHLRLRGFMALPPLDLALLPKRDLFSQMAGIFEQAQALMFRSSSPSSCEFVNILSMGTSDDFELAIAEGATMVRIGTALFGPRPGGNQ